MKATSWLITCICIVIPYVVCPHILFSEPACSTPLTPDQYDVIIDEIMADPSPTVNLPDNEWIELKNTSTVPVNLKGWRIADLSAQSGPFPDLVLLPDSFLIVCAENALSSMSAYGNTIAVTGFPTINNKSGTLFLRSPQNNVIHSVNYTDKWYRDETKKAGGWTLEMIDTKAPCSGSANWTASTGTKGGTPAKKNSVDAKNPDITGPRLLWAYTTDSTGITLVFDESLDSANAGIASNFTIGDNIGAPVQAVVLPPLFDHVSLQLNSRLLPGKIYTVLAKNVTDCAGNPIASNKNIARTGISDSLNTPDIVINEILFNPPANGTDYLEIYNRSNKIIDLNQTFIASRNSTGAISNMTRLSIEPHPFFPQDFIVITEDAAKVKATYITQNMDAFTEISNMPSFNNDKGTAIILNGRGDIIDELSYNENWHFNLIDNREGVALERIDYNAPTQSPGNWHSAASSVGYGTPGYKNSQYNQDGRIQGNVKLSPEIFSPDNDGQDDVATLEYNLPQPGFVANITIFDVSGKPVRYLQRNALCGTKGDFRWDGLDGKGRQLAIGAYIFFTELFDLKGNKKQFKNAIVLARRN